nr:hypothetical protein BaRGS_033466 [Batillaria attramentaria]
MWRSGGAGEVYAYVTRDQDANFCDRSDVHCNFDYGNSLGRGKWHFQKGKWQNIAQHVQLNTPGHHDGSITVYYNHREVYRINNIALRSKSSVHINGLIFSTFFGGHDDTWASPHSTYTYFKNFVLSTGSTPVGK